MGEELAVCVYVRTRTRRGCQLSGWQQIDPRAQTTLGEKGRGSGKERIRKWTEDLLKRELEQFRCDCIYPELRRSEAPEQKEAGAGS